MPATTLIFLHGLGDSAAGIAQAFCLPKSIRTIFPNAPIRKVTLNGGIPMRAWYDIHSLSTGISHIQDSKGINESANYILELLQQHLSSPNSSTEERIFIGGFSQGAAISLAALAIAPNALRKSLAGIFCCSGYLPIQEQLIPELQKSSSQEPISVPIHIYHGSMDDVIPVELGKASFEALKRAGCENVHFKTFPMGHSFCQQELQDIYSILSQE